VRVDIGCLDKVSMREAKRRAENMKKEPETTRGNPIIIEQAGMRMTVDYRQGVGGDEGLTFDVTVAGNKEGARILRFDCFKKTPHYHIGPSGKNNPARDMKEEGIENPVRWTLEQLKTRLPSLVTEAGYEDIAKAIDQKAFTQSLSMVEPDILAKI
jgi:hypothetical protein